MIYREQRENDGQRERETIRQTERKKDFTKAVRKGMDK